MSLSSQLLTWPTESTIRTVLNIDAGSPLTCHGQTKKNARCKLQVSKENSVRVSGLLSQIASQGSLKTAKSLLQQLAQLVMCKKFHQNQGMARLSSWEKKLAAAKEAEAAVKQEEEDPTVEFHDSRDEFDRMDVVQVEAETSITKAESKSRRRFADEDDKVLSPNSSSLPPGTISSSPSAKSAKAATSKHTFEKFNRGRPRTVESINESIKELILRPLLPTEVQSRGNLYTYTFPENYRDPHPYLKIGYTKNKVQQRLQRWDRKCKYKPNLICAYRPDCYVKVERLVHLELCNSRMTEINCPGCGGKHIEWFEVTETRAAASVALWTSFTRQKPYDKEGNLKKMWRDKIEELDMNDPRCWDAFVNGERGTESEVSELSESDDDMGSEGEWDGEVEEEEEEEDED